MIVVCDSSPLNYLVLIGSGDVLGQIFGEVYAPPAVIRELLDPRAPEAVRHWVTSPPDWFKTRTPSMSVTFAKELGDGEAEAIALARELPNAWLLIDERAGTQIARREGLKVIGTLAVLEEAAERKLIDLVEALSRLQQTNFRISMPLLRAALDRDRQRKRKD